MILSRQRFSRLGRVVNPYMVVLAILSFATGLMVEIIGNVVTTAVPLRQALPILGVASMALGLVLLWLAPRDEPAATIEARTLRTPEERQRYAQRGLIVFVSLYHPIAGEGRSPTELGHRATWIQAAQARDVERLDLPRSNLAPAIGAILAHASRLEHCWLISTMSADGHQPGSLAYVPVLEAYVRRQGLSCTFHSGPDYAVALDDDALVCTKTYDLVRHIYQEASRYGLDASDLVADFTGCPRSMTLGLVLACLSVDRNIQLMGTRYDAAGRPLGPLVPMVFSYDAVVNRQLRAR